MKRVLILGASSEIGRNISIQYANDSEIILVGRSTTKLKKTQKMCYSNGAKKAGIIIQDFSNPLNEEILELYKYKFDVIINLISGSSRMLDKDLDEELSNLIKSDILYVIEFFNNILKKSSHQVKIIFISSILEDIKSPNRIFYGATKSILSVYFNNVKNNSPNVKLLLVKIGTRINHKLTSKKTAKLAKKIFDADLQNLEKINFGLEGILLKAVYYLFPLLINIIIRTARILKLKVN